MHRARTADFLADPHLRGRMGRATRIDDERACAGRPDQDVVCTDQLGPSTLHPDLPGRARMQPRGETDGGCDLAAVLDVQPAGPLLPHIQEPGIQLRIGHANRALAPRVATDRRGGAVGRQRRTVEHGERALAGQADCEVTGAGPG
ncbi:hypothetical protein D3C86_1785240 [compost metagenome]